MAASSMPLRVARASIALAGLLAGWGHARAADEGGLSFELGARAGFALPGGRYESTMPAATAGAVATGRSLSDDVTSDLPLSLLIGVRRDALLFDVRGSYAPVSVPRGDCSTYEPCVRLANGPRLRVALDAQYRAATPTVLQPWAGAGVGIEWLTGGSTQYWGPVFEANLGADHAFASGCRLGPYLGLSAGQLVHAHRSGPTAFMSPVFGASEPPPPTDRDISSRSWHAWIELGIQGAFSR